MKNAPHISPKPKVISSKCLFCVNNSPEDKNLHFTFIEGKKNKKYENILISGAISDEFLPFLHSTINVLSVV